MELNQFCIYKNKVNREDITSKRSAWDFSEILVSLLSGVVDILYRERFLNTSKVFVIAI